MSKDLFLSSPPETSVRPAGLGSLGKNSVFFEPFTIRSPHRVHIGDDVVIGARALLSVVEDFKGAGFEPVVKIGDGCEIGRDLFLSCTHEITIGKRVAISARVFIGDTDRQHENAQNSLLDEKMAPGAPVRIGDGAALGVGSIILPGVTIGERAMISAGSVVTRDIPPRCTVFGNPARIVRSWDEDAQQWVAGPPRR